MPACPHCSEQIDKLSGFVSQDELRSRLAAKGEAMDLVKAERDQLRAELKQVRTEAEGYSAIVAERDAAVSELQSFKTRQERTAALGEAGLDTGLLETLELLHRAHVATAGDEDEAHDFGAWLAGPARENPLLTPHFAAKGTQAPSPSQAPAAPPAPNRDAPPGSSPPPPQGKMTQAQVAAYFASPGYRSMPIADQRKEMERLQRELMGE